MNAAVVGLKLELSPINVEPSFEEPDVIVGPAMAGLDEGLPSVTVGPFPGSTVCPALGDSVL